jgi:hypothetical protein
MIICQFKHFQAKTLKPSPAAKMKERKLNSYFPVVQPQNITATEAFADTSTIAEPQIEKNDIRVNDSEPILNEVQIGHSLNQDLIPVSKVSIVECNQQPLILPSFEDEDFDFNLEPVGEACYSVQRYVDEPVREVVLSENEILSLDD